MAKLCSSVSTVLLFCAIFSLILIGCKAENITAVNKPVIEVVAETKVLETVSLKNSDVVTPFININGRGAAYVTQSGDTFTVYYMGKSSEPLQSFDTLVFSRDGKRIAYSAMANEKWKMYIDGKVAVVADQVNTPVFSPDNQHVAYASSTKDVWYSVIDNRVATVGVAQMSSPYFNDSSTKIIFSEKVNSQSVSRLVISDLNHKRLFVKEACGDNLVINNDKTRIAAIMDSGGKKKVITLSISKPDTSEISNSFDSVSNIVFGSDNISVGFYGVRGRQFFLVVNNKEFLLPEGNLPASPVLLTGTKGVGTLVSSSGGFFLFQAMTSPPAKPDSYYEEAADLTYSSDGLRYAFAAKKGNEWFIVLNGIKGPNFERVVAPLFSPDGRYLIYRARIDGNKRFVVVADAQNGTIIRKHAVYERVFQPVFTEDGKSIAYGVKDGNSLIWKVEKLN